MFIYRKYVLYSHTNDQGQLDPKQYFLRNPIINPNAIKHGDIC